MQGSIDTIYALASAPGRAGVSVIRVSSPNGFEPLAQVMDKFNKIKSSPRQFFLTKIYHPQGNELIDEAMAVYFKKPASFTGEHVLEIHAHGSGYVLERMYSLLASFTGFRLAEPGEFSKRAFLNGKMDLVQAEGLNALVHAETSHQLEAAKQLKSGYLSNYVQELRDKIIHGLSLLSVGIDFPDEQEASAVQLTKLLKPLKSVREDIQNLINSYGVGRILMDGLQVLLIGPPNAGKSTLFNHLLGRDRAIVSDEKGTTRDFIEGSIFIEGRLVRLIDMAGIHDSFTDLESKGFELTKTMLSSTDLVLNLIPADEQGLEKKDFERLGLQDSTQVIDLQTKSDLKGAACQTVEGVFPISCANGAGVEELRQKIKSCFQSSMNHSSKNAVLITNQRHLHCLELAFETLGQAIGGLQSGLSEECIAFELQLANQQLGELMGSVDQEEVFDKIFTQFCLGK